MKNVNIEEVKESELDTFLEMCDKYPCVGCMSGACSDCCSNCQHGGRAQ